MLPALPGLRSRGADAWDGQDQPFREHLREGFAFILSLLERTVDTVEQERYWGRAGDAAALAPHEKDVPYFALALHENAPIWSDETAFRAQDAVTVYTIEGLYDAIE